MNIHEALVEACGEGAASGWTLRVAHSSQVVNTATMRKDQDVRGPQQIPAAWSSEISSQDGRLSCEEFACEMHKIPAQWMTVSSPNPTSDARSCEPESKSPASR